MLPAMEWRQVVGPHQPGRNAPGIYAITATASRRCVTGAQLRLDIRDGDRGSRTTARAAAIRRSAVRGRRALSGVAGATTTTPGPARSAKRLAADMHVPAWGGSKEPPKRPPPPTVMPGRARGKSLRIAGRHICLSPAGNVRDNAPPPIAHPGAGHKIASEPRITGTERHMASYQYVYHMDGVSKTLTGRQEVLREHSPEPFFRASRSAGRRSTARAIHPDADHGGHRQGFLRRGLAAQGARVATSRRSRISTKV